jgi:trimethylamine---corrinoid protein Co-methyltransferase
MSLALVPPLDIHQVERIHERSLSLLEDVGVVFNTRRALDVLAAMDCPVDYERRWASLPRTLVEWALTQVPRTVTLHARNPDQQVVLNGRRPHHTTDSQGVQTLDWETGQRRPSTSQDLALGLLFADALDRIEIVNVMVAANDVASHLRTLHHFALAFTQTGKPIRTGVLHARQVPFLAEMVRAVTGQEEFRPIFSAVDCTISPLMHEGPMTEACIELAKLAVPIMVYPMPLAGGTAPATIGGTVLLHNAEFLSGLTLFQAVQPGTPIIYGTGASQLDMRTGRYGGSANGHSLVLALRELARFYHLPVNVAGLSTASHQLDAQYGHQATANCLLAHLMQADEIYSMGLLGSAQVLSLEKMVLDNHLAREVEIMVQPILVDDEHLQIELIRRVGIGGHYLKQPETRAFTRQEYVPVWPPAGKTVLELARQEVLEIMHRHQPPPLPDGAAEGLEAILARADRALADS